MTYSGFEKKLNIVIYDILNGHGQFDMYEMVTDFGHMLEYDLLDMILRYKDKYALYEGYRCNIMRLFSYDLWLLTLWSAISV